MITPSKRNFLELVKNGKLPPLHKEIPYLHPHLIYDSLASPNSFLLESMKGPMKIARYSFLCFDRYLIFKVLVTPYKQMPSDHLPPFQGGAVGVLSYDFVQYLERLPKNTIDDLDLPDAHFLMIDKLVAFDHQEKKSWIIICPGARNAGTERCDWSEKYDEAEHEIEGIQ